MEINPEKFALAVVRSSDPKLAVSQKLAIYEDAFNKAKKATELPKANGEIGFQSLR